MTIVDIHCHTFNGDDLPVKGFVHRVLMHNLGALRVVSWVLDRVGQIGTPGYEAERGQLDQLLGYRGLAVGTVALVEEPAFDDVVEDAFQALRTEDPALLVEAERDMASAEGAGIPDPEAFSPAEGFRGARRAIAWAVLLRRSRLDITGRLVATFPEVDLFTPMTVDMAVGLRDQPDVTMFQQVELQEKISRLSMLGGLGRDVHARVHPFVGFDPRSEFRSRKVKDVISALEVVMLAVERFGFVGVKLYPPMGFRPTANIPDSEMDEEQAAAADAIMDELFTWCESEDVAVTAHCNASNEARSEYRLYSSPELWGVVLDKHPGLRLNLGHFGGAHGADDLSDSADAWPTEIARLAGRYSRLYADTGNHRIDDRHIAAAQAEMLQALFRVGSDTAAMRERLMYGSDWLMLALLPDSGEFLRRYRAMYQQEFGEASVDRFMGGAALEFLGLTDPASKSRSRLIDRYKRVGAELPAWLGAPAAAT